MEHAQKNHLSAMSQELSLGEALMKTASGDPMEGFSCERRMSSAYKTHTQAVM